MIEHVPVENRVFNADYLDADTAVLDLVFPDGVVVRGRCRSDPFSGGRHGADAMTLVGGDADGFSISSESVIFDQPTISGRYYGRRC